MPQIVRKQLQRYALFFALASAPSAALAGGDGTVTLQLSEKDYQQLAAASRVCTGDDPVQIENCKKIQSILRKVSSSQTKAASSQIKTSGAEGKADSPAANKKAVKAMARAEPAPASAVASPPVNAPTPMLDPKRLFIRADPIDNFWYPVTPNVGTPKGASVSYTNNGENHTRSATINGMVSYVLIQGDTPTAAQDEFQLINSVAAFGYANGSWNHPLKTVPVDETARYGADWQLRLVTPWQNTLRDVYLSVDPYEQTDFYNRENARGLDIALQPVIAPLALGVGKKFEDYFSFVWVLRPEFDERKVSAPGVTDQIRGTYDWLGFTARGYLSLFPVNGWHNWGALQGRLLLTGTYEYYSDRNYGQTVRYYSTSLQYNLGDTTCEAVTEPDVYPNCTISGGSTISFEYDHGTNKDSLVPVNQWLVKLTYAH